MRLQLLRVAELSPAKAGRKGSPLRPSVVSPEASALVKKSGKGGKQPSRWSRKQEEPAGSCIRLSVPLHAVHAVCLYMLIRGHDTSF